MENRAGIDWLTVPETCAHYRISRATLYRWMEQGLPSHQVGPRSRRLFTIDEIDEFLRSRWSDPVAGQETAP